jgi:RHS repeat-associated protein
MTLPGGSATDYSYDPLMRIESIVAEDPGQNPLMTRDYSYSAAGNITTKDTEHGNYSYQYDELQRLTEAVNPLGADEAYSYDALGNRLTSAGMPGDWHYNANNELLSYDNVSYAHDDNGNTIRKTQGTQETHYIYDVEDRLIRVEDNVGDVIAEYYYDPFGRRLWKEIDGIRIYFVYSDEGLIGEYDENGAEIRGYGYAPDSQWSTDPLFYKQQGQYFWYQNDHLGTPQKIIETNGRVVWSALYDSFGNVQIETAEVTNNLRFAGQYHDAETGLYYNLNRYYDPTIGRYLRTEPYGEGLNLYAYVFNNPNSLIDPLGLCAVRTAWDHWPEFWKYLSTGRWLGTGFGEEATLWYAEMYNETNNPLYALGGGFAALWTKETWFETSLTLLTTGKFKNVGAIKNVSGLRPIVIGENMEVRVIVEAIKNNWVYFKPTYTDKQAIRLFIENMKWVVSNVKDGRKIIDIGIDLTRKNRSWYYRAEKVVKILYKKI